MSVQPTIEPCLQQRYVRITNVRSDNLVEFEFSIGDPTLNVELVLPYDQYRIFCARQNAKELTPEQEAQVDYDSLKWRFGQPGVHQ
ncbi:phenol hydroxylase subunit [Thalassolituus maritimus]|uniref:phenol hydroxylase subunit n=1 Tax=Thalassolituus maritimus TaxID=484498 RepID=UPI0026F08E73|nr:phenol hydroxylase subunit [Thalassolituus maritimus]|tara:strand:- start:128 stop:385 length:258 start_codon:yes stop_codon:yes gene_type:complete